MSEALKHKQSGSGRPLSHSFRHTAHGSKSGSSWGLSSSAPSKDKNTTDAPNSKLLSVKCNHNFMIK